MGQEIQPQKQAKGLMLHQPSKNLISSLTNGQKIEIAEYTATIMPNGNPDFEMTIATCSPIRMLAKESGTKPLRAVIFLLVKNFCESVNVVRNMTEDQMIDAASMLLDECYDYSMEDYLMMFTMAKRGKLVKVLDRLDIQIIGQILTAYDELRAVAKERIQEAKWRCEPKEFDHKQIGTPIEKQEENFRKLQDNLRQLQQKLQSEREEELQQKAIEHEQKHQNLIEKLQQHLIDNGMPADHPAFNLDEFRKNK